MVIDILYHHWFRSLPHHLINTTTWCQYTLPCLDICKMLTLLPCLDNKCNLALLGWQKAEVYNELIFCWYLWSDFYQTFRMIISHSTYSHHIIWLALPTLVHQVLVRTKGVLISNASKEKELTKEAVYQCSIIGYIDQLYISFETEVWSRYWCLRWCHSWAVGFPAWLTKISKVPVCLMVCWWKQSHYWHGGKLSAGRDCLSNFCLWQALASSTWCTYAHTHAQLGLRLAPLT